jgi:hypothetical protein
MTTTAQRWLVTRADRILLRCALTSFRSTDGTGIIEVIERHAGCSTCYDIAVTSVSTLNLLKARGDDHTPMYMLSKPASMRPSVCPCAPGPCKPEPLDYTSDWYYEPVE